MKEVDVVIAGGGPAGLSAALCLGRARKRVLLFDTGSPRHAVADGVHNFLTREGLAPAELRRIAWEQMKPYDSVRGPIDCQIVDAKRDDEHVIIEDSSGEAYRCRALLIATGVIDEHPAIPGYQERWGHSIHHCPFCHGWEIRDQSVAVLASAEHAEHMAPMLSGWTDDIAILTNGDPLSDEQKRSFGDAGIPACDLAIAELRGPDRALEEIVLGNGSSIRRSTIFSVTPQRQVPLVSRLELSLSEQGYVVVDEQMQTSRAGIYAAGDVTSRMQQVVESAAQGFRAGAMITAMLNM